MTRAALLLALLAGCIDVPPAQHGQCSTAADCAAGEACEESVCWGNPPTGMFAATLGPPSDRSDLVSTEVGMLAIPTDGWFGDLAMPAPATLSGRVEVFCPGSTTCDSTTSVGATISITRRPLFAGGPGFRGSFAAKDGLARGTDTFSATLPRSQVGDPDYVITVVPNGLHDEMPPSSGVSPAMIAPPRRLSMPVPDNSSIVLSLGGATARTVTGVLMSGDGAQPLAGYRVVALGRWEAGAPLTEVSTVDFVRTGQGGQFSLTLSDDLSGSVVIEARPYLALAPTLYLAASIDGPAHTLAQLQNLGGPKTLDIPIVGFAGDGSMQPVSGAAVTVTGSYEPGPPLYGTRAVLSVSATTGDDGIAHVTVLDDGTLNPGYKLSVAPPAGSTFGVVYATPLDIHDAHPMVQLPNRFALRGVVVDTSGAPISNVSVTAHASLRFTWGLDDAAQQFLTNIAAATAVTPGDGTFVVFVDPYLSTVWAGYDLALEPPMGSSAPSWLVPDIELETPAVAMQTSLSLDAVTVPNAANIHGRIVDSSGDPVSGAELRIFAISPDPGLCAQVANPPASCAIPAQLLGHGPSDDSGTARLLLPRP
jgi:hypothetical protein